MYIPEYFRITDRKIIIDFIKKHSFGILAVISSDDVDAVHIPFLVDEYKENFKLWGHLAEGNMIIENSTNMRGLAIFQGPDAYISPAYYKYKSVPTWDYMTVHVHGTLKFTDFNENTEKIKKLIKFFEPDSPIPDNLSEKPYFPMLRQIKGFYLIPDKIECAFKLGQNHPIEDQMGVLNALTKNENLKEMTDLMEKNISIYKKNMFK
ncbi:MULTISPECIES: FMN-binding negative transcriptional regulator [Acidiplasma]|uniref:Transcriptional regulator n=1 Tax=Acidiplasma aeolicum TaxID=507754 RepID=A0A0N8VKL6_9ARCH|nr:MULTISPECIES: FMN-binding negative transcriptional regulator [Acidiplasma]KPV46258.1 hypothetical protein SE19_06275 [Acidiplasma aeolicum]KQB34068.1 hypothetical protein AOG54_05775 [Acidiplasma aeolicum]